MSKQSTQDLTPQETQKPQLPQKQQYDGVYVKGKLKYGNKDYEKKYDISPLRAGPGFVIVRHFSTFLSPSGVPMEDPGSVRFQVYEKEIFESYSALKNKKGVQEKSVFDQQGLGVDVLHFPN